MNLKVAIESLNKMHHQVKIKLEQNYLKHVEMSIGKEVVPLTYGIGERTRPIRGIIIKLPINGDLSDGSKWHGLGPFSPRESVLCNHPNSLRAAIDSKQRTSWFSPKSILSRPDLYPAKYCKHSNEWQLPVVLILWISKKHLIV